MEKKEASVESILGRIQNGGRPSLSFEVFPPRREEDFERLLSRTLPRLVKLNPDFISITCSPRGKNCDRVAEIASIIEGSYRVRALAHVTCQWADEDEMRTVLDRLQATGIRNILAVRGDPIPEDECKSRFPFATRLVEYIRAHGYPFCVAVSAYPEGRVEGTIEDEIKLLREKVAAGADFSISQLFLDSPAYLDFVRQAESAGLTLPILAGIMPVVTLKARNFALKCGPKVGGLYGAVMGQEDPKEVLHRGIEAASRQAAELTRAGAGGIHWYVLNEADPIEAILERTGKAGPS